MHIVLDVLGRRIALSRHRRSVETTRGPNCEPVASPPQIFFAGGLVFEVSSFQLGFLDKAVLGLF